MRIGNIQPGRPAYYDRNPITRTLASRYLALSPSNFVDITYTVPTNKKAYVQAASAKVMRITVAGTNGRVSAISEYVQQNTNHVDICEAAIFTNTVGVTDSAQFGGMGLLTAGDVWITETQADAVGGSCDIYITAWLIEFDA